MSRGVVVVTGAAGGIGTATTRAFASAGYRVAVVDVDESVLALGDRLGLAGIVGFVADHRDLSAVQALMEEAASLGPVQHVATLAAIALPDEIDQGLPHPDTFRASIELNLLGHVNVLWAAQPHLFAAEGDRSVTFCSSVNALQGWGEPAYSAAKAGLLGLVHALAGPYGRRGVRVNAVTPGTIDTPAIRGEYEHDPGHLNEMRRGIALGRLGRPEDVAAVFLAIARDLTHVTGQSVVIDGGQTVMR